MKPFSPRILLVCFFLAGIIGLRAQTTINFTSEAFQIGKTSSGALLDDSYTFAVGSFGSFTPDLSNVTEWISNFTVLPNTGAWVSEIEYYSGSATVTDNSGVFSTTTQGFVWGYNTLTIGAGTEWILLTNDSWLFPNITPSTTVAWTSTDVGTYAIIGAINALHSDPYLQTANVLSAVPEPSTYALMAGIVMLGFVWFRRRSARA